MTSVVYFFPERARADVTQSWHFVRFFGPSRVHRIDSGIWRFCIHNYTIECARVRLNSILDPSQVSSGQVSLEC